MTIHEERKLSMMLAVRDYNIAGGTILKEIPNMESLQGNLSENIIGIQAIRQAQEIDKSGIKISKSELKTDMIDKSIDVVKKVEAYAIFINNHQLKNAVHYTISDLKASADTILRDKCQVIFDMANANISHLEAYKVNQEILEKLQTAINNFNAAIPQPRLGQVDKKDATTQLKALFAKADNILKKMDAMIEVIRTSNLNFYNGFKSARIIIESGNSTALKGTAVDALTQENLKNVEFEFMPENADSFKSLHKGLNLSKKTALKGAFYFKFLPAGNYTVIARKKGYENKTVNVSVVNGEFARIKVELTKI